MQIIVAIHRLLITGTYYSYIAAIGLFAIHKISKGTQFPYLELISHLLLISVLGGIFKIVDIGTLVSSDQPDDNLFSGHHCPRAIDLPTPSIVFLSVIGCCITSFILGYSCGHRVSPSQSSKHSDSQISTSKIVMADNSQRKFALKSKRLNMKSPPPISSSQASLHEYESVCINETESVVPSETVSHDISESVMTGGGPNFLEIQIGKSGVSYESLIADARASLSAILTMRSTLKGEYESCNWALVRSSSSCHIWVSRSDKMLREGILIRGVASLKADPRQVLDYIIDKDLTLGIEGVVYRADDSSVLMSDGVNRVLSRTVRCKSGSIIGYNREFSLITSISQEKDNKFVIASRSFPVEVKAQQSQSKKEKVSLIHGVLYASGYHIQPQFQSGDRGGHGCEISFATHLDFRGSKVSRTNSIKADVLIGSLYKSMETIKFKLEKSSEFTAHSKITGHTTSSEITNLPSTSDSIAPVSQLSINELNTDDMEMKFELPSSSGLPPLSPHGDSDGAIDLSEDQKQQLFDVAQEALSRMRSLHRSVVSPNHGGVGGRSDDDDSDVFGIDSQTTGDRRNQWETFYNHDGITVKEFNDRQSPIGILNATVSTQVHLILRASNL